MHVFILLVVLVVIKCENSTYISRRTLEVGENCNDEFHNTEAVARSVVKATSLSERFPTDVPIKDRLAVMILFSKGFSGINSADFENDFFCEKTRFQSIYETNFLIFLLKASAESCVTWILGISRDSATKKYFFSDNASEWFSEAESAPRKAPSHFENA